MACSGEGDCETEQSKKVKRFRQHLPSLLRSVHVTLDCASCTYCRIAEKGHIETHTSKLNSPGREGQKLSSNRGGDLSAGPPPPVFPSSRPGCLEAPFLAFWGFGMIASVLVPGPVSRGHQAHEVFLVAHVAAVEV